MNKRKGDWIQTYTGIPFYPLDPKPEDINIIDIAHSLSLQCRFTGHSDRFYSVAQHSLIVSDLCSPRNALHGLLHDASEAYLTDVPRPIKPLLTEYKQIEDNLQLEIFLKYGLVWPIPNEIKIIDISLCITEAKALGFDISAWGDFEEIPILNIFDETFDCMQPRIAENLFINKFNNLLNNIAM